MIKFDKFVEETAEKEHQILEILSEMDEDEIDEFGEVLYSEFFDDSDEELNYFFDKDDVIQMIEALGAGMLDVVLDLLSEESEESEEGELPEEDLDEGFSRIMKKSNMNRKKRKFMKKSKAELRKTKAQRKRLNRQTKAKRKRIYRANKAKIKAYQKSRRDAIKKGIHKVKLRRKSG